MNYKIVLFIFLPFFLFSQEKKKVQLRQSKDFKTYYGRYTYYKDIFNNRNEVIIPIDINVWQKDDGTGNYPNTPANREALQEAIANLNRFYTENIEPTDKIPGVHDYSTTKIHFVLMDIYFNRSTKCWKLGGGQNYNNGVFLNHQANKLHPKGKKHLKIHVTGANAGYQGYASFPSYNLNHEHFIVTLNKRHSSSLKGGSWAFAIHLAHEMGHNLDLYHTYSRNFNACDQSDPDYLDDVFGRGKNAVCPRKGGWDCDPTSPNNTCSNNIMGGWKGAHYFSPKQIQRMHRALALKSIGKYAIPFHFDYFKTVKVDQNRTWDFNMKVYTDIMINKGDTLIVRGTIRFAPEVTLKVDKEAVLIIDGGTLTNAHYFGKPWQGVKIKREGKRNGGKIILKNGGKIENTVQRGGW